MPDYPASGHGRADRRDAPNRAWLPVSVMLTSDDEHI
jgi:hypothetical protein